MIVLDESILSRIGNTPLVRLPKIGREFTGVNLLAGVSAGAALAAGLQTAATLKQGNIVMIFPDGGTRYLDEEFWND